MGRISYVAYEDDRSRCETAKVTEIALLPRRLVRRAIWNEDVPVRTLVRPYEQCPRISGNASAKEVSRKVSRHPRHHEESIELMHVIPVSKEEDWEEGRM
jgi:hypothetical protein